MTVLSISHIFPCTERRSVQYPSSLLKATFRVRFLKLTDEGITQISGGVVSGGRGGITTYISLMIPASCREAGNIKGNTRTNKQLGFYQHRLMCSIFLENQLK